MAPKSKTKTLKVKKTKFAEASDRLFRKMKNCSLCKSTMMQNPKVLPCIHTFCLECLENYGEDKQPGEVMACPVPLCHEIFTIPQEGFEKLPNNVFVEEYMSASFNESKGAKSCSRPKCGGCKTKEAKKFCEECALPICGACLLIHGNFKATSTHKVVKLKESEDPQDPPIYTIACPSHEDKKLELHCNDCSKPICSLCLDEKHKTHYCEDLQTASKKYISEFKSCNKKLKKSFNVVKGQQQSFSNMKTKALQQIPKCELEIKESGDALKRHVDMQCKKLLNQLDEVKVKSMQKMETKKNEVDRQLLLMSSLRMYMEELVEKGSICAISHSAKDLLARAKKLLADQVELSKSYASPDQVTFEPSSIPGVIGGPVENQVIGSIAVNGHSIASKMESFLVLVGYNQLQSLTLFGNIEPAEFIARKRMCKVSLERPDSITMIDSPDTWIRHGAVLCVVSNVLYALGIGQSCQEVWKWDAASDWTRCTDMMSSREEHSVVVVDSTIYSIGGKSDADAMTLNSIEAYNTQTDKWTAKGQLTNAVHSAACVVYENSIFVFGGRFSSYVEKEKRGEHGPIEPYMSTGVGDPRFHGHGIVQVYDIAKCFTVLLPSSMPREQSEMRVVMWEKYAIMIARETCFVYNFESQEWKEKRSHKSDAYHFGLVLHEGTIFIAVGRTVRSVAVRDVIEKKQATWKHHATIEVTPELKFELINAVGSLSLSMVNET